MARPWLALLALVLPLSACISVNVNPLSTGHYTKVYIYVEVRCPGEVEVKGTFEGFPFSAQGNLTVTNDSFFMNIKGPGSYSYAITFKDLRWLEIRVYYGNAEIYELALGKCLGLRASYSRLDLLYLGYGVPEGVGELEIGVSNYCSKPVKAILELKVNGEILKSVEVGKCKTYKDIIVPYSKCLAQSCYLEETGLTCVKARDVLVRDGIEYVPKKVCLRWVPKLVCKQTFCSQTAYGTKVERLCTAKTFNKLISNFTNYLMLGPEEYKPMKLYVRNFNGAEVRVGSLVLEVKPQPKPLLYFNLTLDFLIAFVAFALAIALIATL